ncbi:hypothetical protein L226DRAFT_136715 [Lentinus tigrinus ALCF2SS1-7]|uniref:uncharacterized protein n=1 Tax=Lentinus tigrinus ALCF2SS1-7 TaxID=1328758 RepID=UPI001165DCEF|nr:hypothetical protein L226DRAFT_136715 [Lentinus tigrinus ALCF2SS1-7]
MCSPRLSRFTCQSFLPRRAECPNSGPSRQSDRGCARLRARYCAGVMRTYLLRECRIME